MRRPSVSTRPAKSYLSGFTIVELLVASAVLMLILGITLALINQTSSVVRRASDKITEFQSARAAFDLITQNLSQATLASYWDYDNPTAPTKYLRTSQLHFLVGNAGVSPFAGQIGTGQAMFFQAPLGFSSDSARYGGLDGLINSCGYFIKYGDDSALPPPFNTTPKYRYRLMQVIQPSEAVGVYSSTTGNSWVQSAAANAVPIADNIIYLAVWPRKATNDDPVGSGLTDSFSYDSRKDNTSTSQPETANQLPPIVQITIVAIDETSAGRYCIGATPPSELSGVFNGLFATSTEDRFSMDLSSLRDRLAAKGINYRVFTSLVPIRESKMQ